MISSDKQLLDSLEDMGLSVVVKGVDAATIQPEEADGKTFVFISPSVTASLIGIAFRDVKVPILVSESFLYDDMLMTGPTAGVDYGLRSGRDQLDILEAGHPIAGTFTNSIPVTSFLTSFMWGNPTADALRVAEVSNSGGNNQVAIFVYECGDQMVGMEAPNMRIGYYLRENAITLSTSTGWELLENTVNYVLSEYCKTAVDSLSMATDTLNVVSGETVLQVDIEKEGYVPAGYTRTYLLTSEPDGTVISTSDTLDFNITDGGDYGIYSMVYLGMPGTYDFFDTTFFVLGQTTLSEIEVAMQTQNVCTAIDTAGVQFTVVACQADAGALDIPSAPSLINGSVTLSTTHTVPPTVPSKYNVKYLLSRGTNSLLIDKANSPEFMISDPGEYKIHTLVYDSIPGGVNYLDLDAYQLGVAKIADIAAQITADRLCADLDFAGASVEIDSCSSYAGVLDMALDTASLRVGPIDIEATIIESPVVPSGYVVKYILTSGADQVIEGIGDTPVFTVNSSAPYEIHAVVFNPDSTSGDYLDLSSYSLGEALLPQVIERIDTSGICADLTSPGGGPTLVVSAVFFIQFEISPKPGPRNVLLWILSEAVRDGIYSVERSVDGILYNVIYTRKELSSERSPVTYVYVDLEPRPGKNYYRIKFTNIDNSFFYSRVILVENDETITPEFKIFPNPTFDEVTFEPLFQNPGVFDVSIVDSRGASVYRERVNFQENPLKTIDIEYLPRGIYHVNFIDVSSGERSSYNLLRQQRK